MNSKRQIEWRAVGMRRRVQREKRENMILDFFILTSK